MRSGGGDARITDTPKNTKVVIGGRATEEEMMWCKVPTSTTRTNVDEERGSGEGVRPKPGRDISVEEKSAHTIIESAKNPFGVTILCEVYRQVRRRIVPCVARRVRTPTLSNSLPLSVCKA